MKKIIALLIMALMLCSSMSTAFAMPPPYIEKVVISGEEEITIYVGETINLEAVATPVGVDSAYIAWATDKDAVVAIDAPDPTILLTPPSSSAQITALSVGEVTLTAYTSARYNPTEYSDARDSIKITVIDPDAADRNECEEKYNISYYPYKAEIDLWYPMEGKIKSMDELTEAFPNKQEILSKYDEEFFENKFIYVIESPFNIKVDSIEEKGDNVIIWLSMPYDPDDEGFNGIDTSALVELDKAWVNKYIRTEGSPASYGNMAKISYYGGIDFEYDGWDAWDEEPFPESRRTVIRSATELTAFIEKASYLPSTNEEYKKVIATYDDDFFKSKALIFVNHLFPDGSGVYYGISKVASDGNKFTVEAYQRCLPSYDYSITEVCDWLVVFEVPSYVLYTMDFSLNIDETEIISCSPSDLKLPITFDELYNIKYYTRKEDFLEDTECKISSYEELQRLLPECEEILSRYDEAFFEDKFLYKIGYLAPNPAYRVEITNVTNTLNSVSIEVTGTYGGQITAQVLVPWTIILEMDRIHYDKHISTNLGVVAEPVTAQANATRKGAFYLTETLVEVDLGEDNGKKCVKVGEKSLYYSIEKQRYVGLITDHNVLGTTISNVFISDGTPDKLVYGNVDGDENYEEAKDAVDSSDLAVLKRAIRMYKNLSGKWLIASDLDGDGICTSSDLLAMKIKIKNN